MKNVTLLLASMALCSSAFSQECFIKAGLGAGMSASSFRVVSGDAYRNHSGLFSMEPQLGIGHRFGKLQVESGIGYWTSGVSFTSPDGVPHCGLGPIPHNTQTNTNEQPVNPINRPVSYSITNPHLVVPLVAGYYIGIGKKLSVVPGVGVEGLYNFKGRMSTDVSEAQSYASIHYDYNKFGAAIVAKADVQYQIGGNLGIWCSPSYQNMISSLTTKMAGDAMSRTYDRAMMLNAGVRWTMHCRNAGSQQGK